MTIIREEELNMVAGGNIFETGADGDFLYKEGLMDCELSQADLIFHWVKSSGKVDEAWAKAGITSVTKPFASNQYFKDGTEITQGLAWLMVDPS